MMNDIPDLAVQCMEEKSRQSFETISTAYILQMYLLYIHALCSESLVIPLLLRRLVHVQVP